MSSHGEFGRTVRAELQKRGLSIRAASKAMNYNHAFLSRVLAGKQDPSPELVDSLDALLDAGGALVKRANREHVATNPTLLNGACGDDYAHTIRETSRKLIELDNDLNGLPIADAAARAFKTVHRRLGECDYNSSHERDIRAAAAELAEITGWALFNAGKFDASRRFNQEALFLAKLSGDRSTERLTLQNMGMLAGWVGRHREELAIARSVLEQGPLAPRVEAIFRAREAQGLAGSASDGEVTRSFDRARSLLQESAPGDSPNWAWWISGKEIDRQQGRVLHETGQWRAAIPVLQRAMEPESGAHVGYRTIASVRLLACLLEMHAWKDAEEEAGKIIPAVSEMSSVVTLNLLAEICRRGEELTGAPFSLRDALRRISVSMNEDPYAI
ncbi:helix-turn-helix domain-containing protein [Streptomyces gobiensis]|uniref:helix-turn-helix domain-containing protein n=1 Tax=Streptomyces gobiensis TaxID=2875706 RepID=UPI001E463B88|nr:helix-turn-helix transcriptional regulator [Streptomyces gobiensis]UGY91187.1 helix-turn-helix domain-containing protein [Streptomyces gobiensis]